jgi:antitoxin component YwqK of YwqJK toxin-antitoxin module
MDRIIYILLFLAACSTGCKSVQALPVREVAAKYTVEAKKNKYIKVFYDTITSGKLNGECSYHYRSSHYVSHFDDEGNSTGYSHDDEIKVVASFRKGLRDGQEKEYRNDTLITISNYVRGFQEGKQIEFLKNDSIVSYYKNGIQHGPETHFTNGSIVRAVNYQNGIKDGQEKYFNGDGKMCAYIDYSYTPYQYGKDPGGLHVYEELRKVLGEDKENAPIEIPEANVGSFPIALFYQYSGSIEIHEYEISSTLYDNFYYGISIYDVVSKSNWIKLPEQGFTSGYSGFFYAVNLYTRRGPYDRGVIEKWVIYIDDDFKDVRCAQIK